MFTWVKYFVHTACERNSLRGNKYFFLFFICIFLLVHFYFFLRRTFLFMPCIKHCCSREESPKIRTSAYTLQQADVLPFQLRLIPEYWERSNLWFSAVPFPLAGLEIGKLQIFHWTQKRSQVRVRKSLHTERIKVTKLRVNEGPVFLINRCRMNERASLLLSIVETEN